MIKNCIHYFVFLTSPLNDQFFVLMIVDLIRETEEMREGIDLDLLYLPGRDPDHRYPDEELDLPNKRAGVGVLRGSREPYHDTVSQYHHSRWIRK